VSEELAVKMTGNERELLKSLQRAERRIDGLERKLKQTAGASREAGRATDDAFGSKAAGMVRNLATGLMGAGGLYAGFRAIRAELEQIAQLQDRAFQTHTTLASAQQDVIRNLQGVPEDQAKQFLADVRGVAADTRVKEKHLLAGAASALSASGQDLPASLKAVTQAARFLPDKPGDIGLLAGSLLDMAKITGTTDAAVNQGYLSAIAAQSRLVDPAAQARNIPPALIGMRQFGATSREAAAAFATQTVQAGDIKGEMSGTAVISMAEQLEEFFVQDKKVQRLNRRFGIDPMALTMGQRIEGLWANPEMAARFMEGASFEKKALGPIRSLLTQPGGEAAEAYRRTLGAIPEPEAARGLALDAVARRYLSPYEPAAEVGRIFGVASEQLLAGNQPAAIGGAVRQGLVPALRDAGATRTAERIAGLEFEARSLVGTRGAVGAAQTILGQEIETRLATTREVDHFLGGPAGPIPARTTTVPRAPTDEDRRIADVFQQMVDNLQEVKDILDDTRLSTKEMARQGGARQVTKPTTHTVDRD